jgi:large subunit ribosomal protein L29
MTYKEINELSPAEIQTKLSDARDQLMQLRLRRQTGQVEKTHTIRAIRKDIARLETATTAKKKTTAAA